MSSNFLILVNGTLHFPLVSPGALPIVAEHSQKEKYERIFD